MKMNEKIYILIYFIYIYLFSNIYYIGIYIAIYKKSKIYLYYGYYNEITGAEFLLNHEKKLNYFMPLLSDEVLGLALQY